MDEENNWNLNISELKRALDEARPHCTPRGLVLINPGNPTGMIRIWLLPSSDRVHGLI